MVGNLSSPRDHPQRMSPSRRDMRGRPSRGQGHAQEGLAMVGLGSWIGRREHPLQGKPLAEPCRTRSPRW